MKSLVRASRSFTDLYESNDIQRLSPWAKRTVVRGIMAGTLSDLALLVAYNYDTTLGPDLEDLSLRTFSAASGSKADLLSEAVRSELWHLREGY